MIKFQRPAAARATRGMSRRFTVALAVLAMMLTATPDVSRGAATCVVRKPGVALPQHAIEARERFATNTPPMAGGWEAKMENARRLREDVGAGRITKQEAAAAGGSAVGGTLNVPILLTLFNDSGTAPYAPASLQIQMFSSAPNGTMREYFEEVSYGNLNVEGDVFPWKDLPGNRFSYTGLSNGLGGGAFGFVFDAVLQHDAGVNFGDYDNDGPDGIPNSGDDDGFVDILVVTHPDIGAECGGSASFNLWSHQYFMSEWGLPVPTNDAAAGGGTILVDRYLVAPALSCNGGMIEIGVYCHELGHALGIPDLYDTDDSALYTGDSDGIGWWGLMGSGNWNQPSSPAHMTAFTKERLGWLTYFDVTQDLVNFCLPPVEINPIAAHVWAQGADGPEYFLAENRQQIGFDTNLVNEGLVIYHVNEQMYDAQRPNNKVNAWEQAKAIDVECADAFTAGHVVNADDLDIPGDGNRGDATDVWCTSGGGVAFTPTSTPDSRSYSGVSTGVSITNIGGCSGVPFLPDWVCANYIVGNANPFDLCIADCASDNCNEIATCDEWWATPNLWIDNDGDGDDDLPAAGIDNKLSVRIQNLGPNQATAVSVSLYAARGAMGLEWPTDAELFLGTTATPILDASDFEIETLTFQYPDLFDTDGHYCIGAVINHGQDPPLSESPPLSNNVAQINSQVLVARAGGGAKTAACPGVYNKDTLIFLYDGYNIEQGPRNAKIRVGSPPNFDDAIIPDDWTLSFLPGKGPFVLSPGMKDSVLVRMSATSASHGDSAYVPLTLWDVDLDVLMGGVILNFKVDCFDPAKVQNGAAQWTTPPGDQIQGPTVRVEWSPVLLDTNGNPELVQLYEVYRSSDQSPFEFLVDKVAIDAEPTEPGFQWYDYVSRSDCPIVYNYRVRAVDAGGFAGAYSDSITLPCPFTSVGSSGPIAENPYLSRAIPNPFGAATTIEYRIPRAGDVDLSIFNTNGERVRRLAGGQHTAGTHAVVWDGNDDNGRRVGSGVYFYKLAGLGIGETRKIVLAR